MFLYTLLYTQKNLKIRNVRFGCRFVGFMYKKALACLTTAAAKVLIYHSKLIVLRLLSRSKIALLHHFKLWGPFNAFMAVKRQKIFLLRFTQLKQNYIFKEELQIFIMKNKIFPLHYERCSKIWIDIPLVSYLQLLLFLARTCELRVRSSRMHEREQLFEMNILPFAHLPPRQFLQSTTTQRCRSPKIYFLTCFINYAHMS